MHREHDGPWVKHKKRNMIFFTRTQCKRSICTTNPRRKRKRSVPIFVTHIFSFPRDSNGKLNTKTSHFARECSGTGLSIPTTATTNNFFAVVTHEMRRDQHGSGAVVFAVAATRVGAASSNRQTDRGTGGRTAGWLASWLHRKEPERRGRRQQGTDETMATAVAPTGTAMLKPIPLFSNPAMMRGPVLVAGVSLSMLIPIVTRWSWITIINLALLGFGIGVTVHDTMCSIQANLRRAVKGFLDGLVLDDILKSLFDPVEGLFAVMIGTIMGNASVYTLPFSTQERIKLFQTCLSTSEEETSTILTERGGIHGLLPSSVQEWLDSEEDNNNNNNNNHHDETGKGRKHPRKNTGEGWQPRGQMGLPMLNDPTGDIPCTGEDTASECDTSEDGSASDDPEIQPTTETEPDPTVQERSIPLANGPTAIPTTADVLTSIFQARCKDMLQQASDAVPDSLIAGLSAGAAILLAAQMHSSPRARRIARNTMEGTASLILSSTAGVGLALLATKHRTRIAHVAKKVLSKDGYDRLRQLSQSVQFRGSLAFFVLWYVGRRRNQNQGSYR